MPPYHGFYDQDVINLLYYLNDNQDKVIKKSELRFNIIKTHEKLIKVLNSLEKRNLIYVEPETNKRRGQIVKILPLGERLVKTFRELDDILSELEDEEKID